eukprot:9496040-Pyramimonas_sp.AAC.2
MAWRDPHAVATAETCGGTVPTNCRKTNCARHCPSTEPLAKSSAFQCAVSIWLTREESSRYYARNCSG